MWSCNVTIIEHEREKCELIVIVSKRTLSTLSVPALSYVTSLAILRLA